MSFSLKILITTLFTAVITLALFKEPIELFIHYKQNPSYFRVGDERVALPLRWFVEDESDDRVLVMALPKFPLPFQEPPFILMEFKKHETDKHAHVMLDLAKVKSWYEHADKNTSMDNETLQIVLDSPLCTEREDEKTECAGTLDGYTVVALSSLNQNALLTFLKDIGAKY